MCRSIKTLRPPFAEEVTDHDVRAAAFDLAVEEIAAATARLLGALEVRPATVREGSR